MSGSATSSRGHGRRAVPLVGRATELAVLADTWRSVREGEGPAGVLVDGPAGVGKSRLVEQAGQDLLEPGDVLMVGHCVDLYGDEMPYGGASDAVRDLIRRHGVEAVRGWAGPYVSALAAL